MKYRGSENWSNWSSPSGSSVHGILQARMLGCHYLLQGILLTQESNSHLLSLLIASKFFNHRAIVQIKKDSVRLSKDRCLLRRESAVRGAPCLTEWSHYAPPLVGSSLSENTAGVQMWQLISEPRSWVPSIKLSELRGQGGTFYSHLAFKNCDCLLAIINSFDPWISK